jgi:hypothetical protein
VVDAAAKAVTDGLTNADTGAPTQKSFPYLANPYDGYHHPDPSPAS